MIPRHRRLASLFRFFINNPSYSISRYCKFLKESLKYKRYHGPPSLLQDAVWINPPSTNRSLFGLIWLFKKININVILPNTPSVVLEMGEYDKKALEFDNVFLENTITKQLPKCSIRIPSCLQKSHNDSNIKQIDFNYYNNSNSNSLFVPFGMHPEARLRGLDHQSYSRPPADRIRIFCAGNLSYPEYRSDTISAHFSLMNRATAITTILNHFPNSASFKSQDIKHPDFTSPICLVDQAKDGLDMESYFSILECSTFIFCPPGVNHPHCHNIFEGMSRGCIPILEYPHLFHPRLTPGVDCLAFHGENDLIKTLKHALSLNTQQICILRNNVSSFYNRYYRPENFKQQLSERDFSSLTLLNEQASLPPRATSHAE
jgi:hypothetical protein